MDSTFPSHPWKVARSQWRELIRWTRPSRSPSTTLIMRLLFWPQIQCYDWPSTPAATTDNTRDGVVRAKLGSNATTLNILGWRRSDRSDTLTSRLVALFWTSNICMMQQFSKFHNGSQHENIIQAHFWEIKEVELSPLEEGHFFLSSGIHLWNQTPKICYVFRLVATPVCIIGATVDPNPISHPIMIFPVLFSPLHLQTVHMLSI